MAARHRRAKRLFELTATRADQSLGTRVRDVSTVRSFAGRAARVVRAVVQRRRLRLHARTDRGRAVKRVRRIRSVRVEVTAHPQRRRLNEDMPLPHSSGSSQTRGLTMMSSMTSLAHDERNKTARTQAGHRGAGEPAFRAAVELAGAATGPSREGRAAGQVNERADQRGARPVARLAGQRAGRLGRRRGL